MQVDSLMVNEGAATYYSDKLRNTLEDFMTIFRNASTGPTAIAPATAERFAGDFYGLLTFLKLPPWTHFAVLRANKLNSSDEYRPWMTNIIIPSDTEIQRIAQSNNTTNRASI